MPLYAALLIVRNHLSSLDAGIKQHVTAQVSTGPNEPSNSELTTDSGEGAKGNNPMGSKLRDEHVAGAILETAKVCCVLERSLESLIGVLSLGSGDGEGEMPADSQENALMEVCLERSKDVKREMGSAVVGIKGVVGFEQGA